MPEVRQREQAGTIGCVSRAAFFVPTRVITPRAASDRSLFVSPQSDHDNQGENAPVTQASACGWRLIQWLLWRCSRRLFCRMLDRTLSYHDRFAAKWRRRLRRKERS